MDMVSAWPFILVGVIFALSLTILVAYLLYRNFKKKSLPWPFSLCLKRPSSSSSSSSGNRAQPENEETFRGVPRPRREVGDVEAQFSPQPSPAPEVKSPRYGTHTQRFPAHQRVPKNEELVTPNSLVPHRPRRQHVENEHVVNDAASPSAFPGPSSRRFAVKQGLQEPSFDPTPGDHLRKARSEVRGPEVPVPTHVVPKPERTIIHFDSFDEFTQQMYVPVPATEPARQRPLPVTRGKVKNEVDDVDIQEIAQRLKRSLSKEEDADVSVISKEEKDLATKLKCVLKLDNLTTGNYDRVVKLGKSLILIQNLHDNLFGGKSDLVLPENPTSTELSHGLKYLQELQRPKSKVEKSIAHAQKLLLIGEKRHIIRSNGFDALIYRQVVGSRLKTNLIIGVDATPSHFGGYCVNLKEKAIEFYVISTSQVPWTINERLCAAEFEMKNFILALGTWHKWIEGQGNFAIFTDNFSFLNSDQNDKDEQRSKYGGRARMLLDHFKRCKGAFVHERVCVNRTKELVRFAKFIQPADDLSRLEVRECVDFLCDMYGIERGNVRGTCEIDKVNGVTTNGGDQIRHTPFHNEVLNTVKSLFDKRYDKVAKFIEDFDCPGCAADLELQSSLRTKSKKVKAHLLTTGQGQRARSRSRSWSLGGVIDPGGRMSRSPEFTPKAVKVGAMIKRKNKNKRRRRRV